MKKYLLVALLLLTMTLVACGSEEAKDTDVNNPVKDSTEVEVPNDTDEPVEPDDTKEPVEPDDTEEPIVEMVDWETWATQADNDEVCFVVWNEKTGTQKVLEPMPENVEDIKKCIYTVEEGDRFAVSRRDNILYVEVNFETKFIWESEEQKYIEIEINPGEQTQISIICDDSNKVISYAFNF